MSFFSLSLSLTGYINDERTNLKFTKKQDKYSYPPFKVKPNAVSSAALAHNIVRTSKCLALFFLLSLFFWHSQSSSVVVRVVLHCAKLNVRVARSEKKIFKYTTTCNKKNKDKKKRRSYYEK